MAWTWPTAAFFATIALLLIAMGWAEVIAPSLPRRGWLPIATTRGDRLFIGLLAAAFVNLLWLLLTDASQWWALGLALALLALVLRKG